NRTPETPAPTPRQTPSGSTNVGGSTGETPRYTTQIPPESNLGPGAVTPPDTPSINTNGQSVPAGGGIANSSPLPVGCDSVMPPVPLLSWVMDVLGFQTDQPTTKCPTKSTTTTDAIALGSVAAGGAVLPKKKDDG